LDSWLNRHELPIASNIQFVLNSYFCANPEFKTSESILRVCFVVFVFVCVFVFVFVLGVFWLVVLVIVFFVYSV